MKQRIAFIALILVVITGDVFAFCGFYVAKADTKLFNKSSQVIIVRDGNQTVITMSNDYQGDAKDFAMVVPVPEVLQKDQIKTVRKALFDKIDAYTAPRIAEYYDENPCLPSLKYALDDFMANSPSGVLLEKEEASVKRNKDLGVKVEAKYQVDEYDILILSAKESSGLETWLIENGYKIPSGAKEVLTPYIRSNLKFFVVKVNLERQAASLFTELSPLQIKFESSRFMLPIRLGMANAVDDQDLVIYTFTKKGRVETTNYRTVSLPANNNVPLFVQNEFGSFYTQLFERSWKREGKSAVMLEYAWDISGAQAVKCDPCATQPFTPQELAEAGVWWISASSNWGNNYVGDLFITRMHARYNRQTFPQDLAFQLTPNQKSFQCRYVTRHPAVGDLQCDAGQSYLRQLVYNRQKELQEYNRLTGQPMSGYDSYVNEYARLIRPVSGESKNNFVPVGATTGGGSGGNSGGTSVPWGLLAMGIGLLAAASLTFRLLEQKLRKA